MQMVKYSIIIVAYNIENYIEQALESCTFSDRNDYEVIVVENNSDDRTLEYIKRYKEESDITLLLIENDQNYGLGIGRNIGMDHASGKFLLFLDGDDWFSPQILDRLDQIVDDRGSDVYLFNHARVYEDGRIVPNKLTKILNEGYRDTLSERADIMRNFGVAWNKTYRTEFVRKNKIRFGEGFYEDIDWNFSALLLSESYYVVSDVLVFYRQRSGSILRSTDIRHFDALGQWRKVLDLYQNHTNLSYFGKYIFSQARNQLFTVLNSEDRLPSNSKKKFVSELSDILYEFRQATGRSHITLKERALSTKSFIFYNFVNNALDRYNSKKKDIRSKINPVINRYVSKCIRYLYKNLYLKQPIEEKTVLFEAFWGQKIDCNPYAISLALERHGYKCLWSLRRSSSYEHYPDANVIIKYSLAYFKALATAKFFVSNANFPDELVKRPGQVHLQTFHGTPLKLMGLDIIQTNPKEMNWRNYANRAKRWDFAISSNPYSTRVWRRNAPYFYRMIESGYPRNDILFNTDPALVERVRQRLGIPPGKKVVLYAPTFRDNQKGKDSKIGDRDVFDAEQVQRAFGDEYILLMRGHYFLKRINNATNNNIIDASSYPVTNELLLAVDILISDYSSIMFDYANLGRPIILYTYDWNDYVASRGTYFDIQEQAPGFLASTFDELLSGIRDEVFATPENGDRLSRFRGKFCAFDDGHATDRVLQEVFGIAPVASNDRDEGSTALLGETLAAE